MGITLVLHRQKQNTRFVETDKNVKYIKNYERKLDRIIVQQLGNKLVNGLKYSHNGQD